MFIQFDHRSYEVYIRHEWCSNPEARSEAWVMLTSVISSVLHEAMLLIEFFSANRKLRVSFMSEPRLSDQYLGG